MEENKNDIQNDDTSLNDSENKPQTDSNINSNQQENQTPQNPNYNAYDSYNGFLGYNGGNYGKYSPYQQTQNPNNYGGYNNGGNIYGNGDGNGYFNGRQPQNNGGPKKSKGGIAGVLIICAVLLVLAVSVIYVFSSVYDYIADTGNNNVTDGTGNTPGNENNPGNNNQPQKPDSSLNDKDFQLEQVPAEEHYKLASVFKLTQNTVVEITTEFITTGSFMQQYVTTGAGSGVIISDTGYIATNHHVIENATKVTVKLANGAEYEAKLVGSDEKSDIAVIKIEPKETLSVATIGVSGDLVVCEEILIIGNPLGSLGGSASNGIVSATARQISIQGNMMTLIQTNAAVNPGNSGGAMFNMSGQLVGIVNAKYTDEAVEGIGFAIPIDTAKPIIEDLIAYGYVTGRPNIGLTVKYGTYIQSVGNSNWITEIRSGSDAEKAGLKKYDEIVSINGISFTSAEMVNAYLDTLKLGDTVKFVVRRYTQSSTSFWGTTYTTEELTFTFTVTEYVMNQ